MSNAFAQFFRQRRTLSSANVGVKPELEISPSSAILNQSGTSFLEFNTKWRVGLTNEVQIQARTFGERQSYRNSK